MGNVRPDVAKKQSDAGAIEAQFEYIYGLFLGQMDRIVQDLLLWEFTRFQYEEATLSVNC